MKPIRSLAAFAVAGLIGGLGVAATAAPVAAAAHVHASASSAVAQSRAKAPSPAINLCAFHSSHFTTYYNGCLTFRDWSCSVGTESSISPPDAVANACVRAVFLFSNSNETGTVLCVRPDSRIGPPLVSSWRSFRVESISTCS